MKNNELTLSEQAQLENFPAEIASDELITYFTLSGNDRAQIPITTQDYNRLGFAVQLCALRFLGMFPRRLNAHPVIVNYLADQLEVKATHNFERYGNRENTKLAHQRMIIKYLKFKRLNFFSRKKLYLWLQERAMEHENTIFLVKIVCEKLLHEKIVRPGMTTILEMVSKSRTKCWEKTYLIVSPIIKSNKPFLDDLLDSKDEMENNQYAWIKSSAVANSSNAILETIEKIEFLIKKGVHRWDLSKLNPNRLKFLFEQGRRSTKYSLRRMPDKKKYSITIVLLKITFEKAIDELVEQFDRNLADKYSGARRSLDNFIKDVSKSTNEKIWLLRRIGKVILDNKIKDSKIRTVIYKDIPLENFKKAIEDCDRVIRPKNDYFFDFFSKSFPDIRKYSPKFLNVIDFKSNIRGNSLLKSINFIKKYNKKDDNELLNDAPTDFIPKRWEDYVLREEDDKISYRYYETCALWELRSAIRSGDIWIENSRKFANPESYLIPKNQWPTLKNEFIKMVGIPNNFSDQLKKKRKELECLFPIVDNILANNNKIGEVRIENDELIVPRYLAEEKEKNNGIENLISNSLPRVDLADILLEVDSWVNFSQHFEHLSGGDPKNDQIIVSIYASIISLACNIGDSQMSQASSIPRQSLIWATNWYLRENTLKPALSAIINYHHQHSLASYWGGGTLSSSDGQRFPAAVKTRGATKNPKYYGYGTGVTNYSWTSDQYSQYGSKIIPSTMRDATYILDAILDNVTELEIIEHTSDTSGYTDIIFALFDLLGLKFCPRLKDIGAQKLYHMGKSHEKYKNVAPLLKGVIHEDYILKHSDEMLRVVASLKMGWVTSSLLINKIQNSKGVNIAANPLREYGRIEKTIHILKYISDEGYQRKIGKQLNKGESLHGLRQFLFFLNESKIRIAHQDEQQLQADCLNLMTNAVILWNTVYMWRAIEELKNNGYIVSDDDIAGLSPCRFEHINRLGKFLFHSRKRLKMRPLRAFK